jgi:hypothetical protein
MLRNGRRIILMRSPHWQIYNTTIGNDRGFYARLLFSDSDGLVIPWVNVTRYKTIDEEQGAMEQIINQIKQEITPAKALTVVVPIYRIFDKKPPTEFTDEHYKEVQAIFKRAWNVFKATYEDELKSIGLSDTLEKPQKGKPTKSVQKKTVKQSVLKEKKASKSKPRKSKKVGQLQLL